MRDYHDSAHAKTMREAFETFLRYLRLNIRHMTGDNRASNGSHENNFLRFAG